MKQNRTVVRALDILELLSKAMKPMSISDIAEAMKLPKSSAHDIVQTLAARGYLQSDKFGSKTYQLGLKTFEVGHSYLNIADVYQLAKPLLQELALALSRTIFLGVLSDDVVTYLDKEEPTRTFFVEAVVGRTQPAHSTGLGKAMLACLTEQQVRTLLGPEPFQRRTENTLTTYAALLADLHDIRTRGYSIDNCENEQYIYCIAMPIRDHLGNLAAAISCSGLKVGVTGMDKERMVAELSRAALDISRKLGFRGNRLL